MKKLTLAILILASTAAIAQSTKMNKFELALAGVSIAGDGLTTQHNGNEINPIARPFVKSPGGSMAYFGGSFAALIYSNHLLRNHTKIRHILNWSVIAGESYWSISNVHRQGKYDNCKNAWITQGRIVAPCRYAY